MITLTAASEKKMDGNYFHDKLLECVKQCKLGPDFHYILAIEAHKSGLAHAHAMVGCDRPFERRFKVRYPGDWEARVRRLDGAPAGYWYPPDTKGLDGQIAFLNDRMSWRHGTSLAWAIYLWWCTHVGAIANVQRPRSVKGSLKYVLKEAFQNHHEYYYNPSMGKA